MSMSTGGPIVAWIRICVFPLAEPRPRRSMMLLRTDARFTSRKIGLVTELRWLLP